MATRALSAPSVNRTVGAVWDLVVDVRNADDYLVDDAPVVTITLPGGAITTPSVETITTGVYRVEYLLVSPGRYTAVAATTSNGSATFAAYVEQVTANAGFPDVAAVRNYDTRDALDSWPDEAVQDALDAEAAAQRSVCRVGAVYPADLSQALKRRVLRNLAMRRLPLAVLTGDGEAGPDILPGNDPEVRRLERPWRRVPIG